MDREILQCGYCGEFFIRPRYKGLHRRFCSNACSWNRPELKDHGRKIGEGRRGIPAPWSKGNGGVCKGRKATPRQLEGLKVGWGRKGPDAAGWKGGVTAQYKLFRQSVPYRRWRKEVLARDGECVWCGALDNLQVDHIKPYSRFPELGLDVDNGRVLCAPCHRKTDTFAGRMHRYPAGEVI